VVHGNKGAGLAVGTIFYANPMIALTIVRTIKGNLAAIDGLAGA